MAPVTDTNPPAKLGLAHAWMGIRPRTLSMAVVPVLAGCGLAWSEGQSPALFTTALTLLSAILIQAGTNLFNDASDAERGNDGPDRLGPQRLSGSGLATTSAVKQAAWVLFSLAVVLGLVLVFIGGLPILIIGLTGLLAGWAYSRGPMPLSHTPLGELFVVGFFGLAAVTGSYLLQQGDSPLTTLVPGLAIGLPAAAVLLINNLRDRKADRDAGRQTLALALGPRMSCWLYCVLMLAPFCLLGLFPLPGSALTWFALPMALWLSQRSFRLSTGKAFNEQLQWTVVFQLLLGILLFASLMLGPAWGLSGEAT